MKASVCIASFNRSPEVLARVLRSIVTRPPPFEYEVIVADDGSAGTSTERVCLDHAVQYHRIERPPVRRNPCVARNVAYRAARGEFMVMQSDDVEHISVDSIATLVGEAERTPEDFVIANVLGCGPDGVPWSVYTGPTRPVPLFFLGAVHRRHVYAVGGNDEDFANAPGYEDQWFADCLIRGQGLVSRFVPVVGHHLYHPRSDTDADAKLAGMIYYGKVRSAEWSGTWTAASGPWEDK